MKLSGHKNGVNVKRGGGCRQHRDDQSMRPEALLLGLEMESVSCMENVINHPKSNAYSRS
jgi:hypothetical protein